MILIVSNCSWTSDFQTMRVNVVLYCTLHRGITFHNIISDEGFEDEEEKVTDPFLLSTALLPPGDGRE